MHEQSAVGGSPVIINDLALLPTLLVPWLSAPVVMTVPPFPVVLPIALPLNLAHAVLSVSPDLIREFNKLENILLQYRLAPVHLHSRDCGKHSRIGDTS